MREARVSFDRHYPKRKDWRKPYRRSAAFDSSCRPHGGCPYCEGNRLYHSRKALELARHEMSDSQAIPSIETPILMDSQAIPITFSVVALIIFTLSLFHPPTL